MNSKKIQTLALIICINFFMLSCSTKSTKKELPPAEVFPISIRFHLEATTKTNNSIVAPYKRGLILYFNPSAIITENHLISARLTSGIVKRYDILLRFNPEGAKLLEKVTRANVNKRLGIFVDNKLVSAPTILQAIPGGTAMISGVFDEKQAKEIVSKLQIGLKRKRK